MQKYTFWKKVCKNILFGKKYAKIYFLEKSMQKYTFWEKVCKNIFA